MLCFVPDRVSAVEKISDTTDLLIQWLLVLQCLTVICIFHLQHICEFSLFQVAMFSGIESKDLVVTSTIKWNIRRLIYHLNYCIVTCISWQQWILFTFIIWEFLELKEDLDKGYGTLSSQQEFFILLFYSCIQSHPPTFVWMPWNHLSVHLF